MYLDGIIADFLRDQNTCENYRRVKKPLRFTVRQQID